MSLFHRKNKEDGVQIPELPEIPELPRLPELSEFSTDLPRPIHQLPRFPNSSLGEKFSQNNIKEAITGREEGDFEDIVDEFDSLEEPQRIQEPQMTERINSPRRSLNKLKETVKEAEPLFVRLDKFKESHTILDNVKKQMHEITHLLNETNAIKEKEDQQLKMWETELQEIKNNIEKIDRDLFSKI